MKRIAVDMDGVLANVYHQFITMHAAEFGKVLSLEETNGRPEADIAKNLHRYGADVTGHDHQAHAR